MNMRIRKSIITHYSFIKMLVYRRIMMKRNIKIRNQIIKKAPVECCNCGSDKQIEYHHIVPLCFGGKDEISNIVPLCKSCHCKAHGKVWRKASSNKKSGRKPMVEYEIAKEYIQKYFAGEIVAPDLIEKLNLNSKMSIASISTVRRYIKEENISLEQIKEAALTSKINSFYRRNLYKKYERDIALYVKNKCSEVEIKKALGINEQVNFKETFYYKEYMRKKSR